VLELLEEFFILLIVTGARLNAVRVVHDQVADVIVEIRVGDSGCSTVDTGSCLHRVAMSRVRPEE
jgi:hypothetical protein